jgi:hypothetical protein
MKRLQYLLALAALLIGVGMFWSPGCGIWGSVIKDSLEYILCKKVAAKYPDKLGGLAPDEWCEVYENVKPFIPLARQMEESGAQRAGFSRDAE